ncbi:MAG TPA: winged helix-turn-helix domain-containing protein [Candidatus Baltobacteraceae bacterium]|nr:winged helix-turn-helix domain-containing protein [Candidatus Baltobacteraceae bacterium]
MAAVYDFAGYRLDVDAKSLTCRGSTVRLTHKAFEALVLLVERAPEIVTRAEFEAAIWPAGFIDPGNVTQTIYMIRRAAARGGGDELIETVNGRGYRLAHDLHTTASIPLVAAAVSRKAPLQGFGLAALRWAGSLAVLLALLAGITYLRSSSGNHVHAPAVASHKNPVSAVPPKARAFWSITPP